MIAVPAHVTPRARVMKAIHVEVEELSLVDATKAYDKLRAGRIRGRAVVVPS